MSEAKSSHKFETAVENLNPKGAFVRTESVYRDIISDSHPEFKPEPNRYHLYISYACPWANGSFIALHLKGLQDIIGVSITHPVWQRTKPDDPDDSHAGWVFRSPGDPPVLPVTGHNPRPCDEALVPDGVNGCRTVRDLYAMCGDNRSSKCTVPILWDKKTNRIVNNESSEINRMLNSAFRAFSSRPASLDLFPEDLEEKHRETFEWIYANINDGVYKCGFSRSQEAYTDAVENLFAALDRVEDILSRQRYILCNSRVTMIDIRLVMTLFRFDEVYTVYFKCNKRMLSSYPNIRNYMREMYQIPGIGSNVNMTHIKTHYYCSHPLLNPFSVIPAGARVLEDLQLPHDRCLKF